MLISAINGRGHAARLDVGANELDDIVHGSARLENGGDAGFFEIFHVLVGNDAADHYQHVVHLVLLEQVHDARNDGIVRAGKNGQADDVNIFLQGRAHNHFRRLPQTRCR